MILLTGGTGFVGRHLVLQFVAEGHRVRVLSRNPGRIGLPDGAAWVQGDLTDAAALQPAMSDIDTVVHAGAVLRGGSPTDPALERVNIGGTSMLARLARDAGVRRFIHISSAGVYGDGSTTTPHRETDIPKPVSPYEKSKLFAEHTLIDALEGSNVSWTILRPQGLYGSERPATAEFFRLVAQKRIWLHGPANVIVHPTHITDLVSAVGLVLAHTGLDGEVVNIGGARSLDYRELVALTGAQLGHIPRQFCAPRWTAQMAAMVSRIWRSVGTPPARLDRLSRTVINRAVDIEKARRLLGFDPIPLGAGLEQTAMEIRRNRAR